MVGTWVKRTLPPAPCRAVHEAELAAALQSTTDTVDMPAPHDHVDSRVQGHIMQPAGLVSCPAAKAAALFRLGARFALALALC